MDETAWIKRHIAPLVTSDGADALRDDVALLTTIGPIIATMDTLVEGVHFLPTDPPATIGQKLIRVNVSDIHAKGAQPLETLLSIAWPRSRSEAAFADLMSGIARDLEAFGVSLIGGDLVRHDGPLTLTLSLTGRCIGKRPVRRSGGRAGEALYVNGEVGWGGIGLEAARGQMASETAERYRVPQISPLTAAQIVADTATASMDVSDGLLLDAHRMADASGCGALLELDRVPLASRTTDLDDILSQCTAGDDYRILMSAPPGLVLQGFTEIGKLTESPGLQLGFRGQSVNPPSTLGFEH
nr:thiamine-phosphate kinase [Hyphomonas sp. Mor2]